MTTSVPVAGSPVSLQVDTISFGNGAGEYGGPSLIIGGEVIGAEIVGAEITGAGADQSEAAASQFTVTLHGSRHTVQGTLDLTRVDPATSRWVCTVDLTASRWGGPRLALPSGTYAVSFASEGTRVAHTVDGSTLPPRTLIESVCAVTATVQGGGELGIHIAAPLTEAELGPAAQARLEADYRKRTVVPEDAIFFESFYGHNVSCNPRGIDRAVAELLPHITRYWSVIDASIAVPEGAIALIEGSEEWWRVRGSAKLLVVNDWLRKRYRKRAHQKVLQTWHGTPLKKIAMARPGLRIRPALASIRERGMWNILLAQNAHSARTIRRAYAYTGPVWQEGYPRNDVLVSEHIDGDAAAVRRALEIPDGVTVLLYAPTWRDDRPGHVDHLDVAAFADNLGPDYLTLIRGHSRSITPGTDVRGHRVLDVTSYPDVSDLFLVADALITDYSSVMFDFSATGKPLYFFAPDLEHYRAQLRGFYFDLDPVAPGPLVQDPTELADLVRDRDAVHKKFATRYAAWQERFNPRDDGKAGRRIVERLVRSGILS